MNATRSDPRSTTRGIALVSVLLVLVAVLLLGVGSLVLTQSNLLIAENLTGNVIARSHAEAGIDATVAVLFDRFEAGDALPSSLPEAARSLVPEGTLAYELVADGGYVLHGDGSVTLRVAGRGARDAEYIAEALVVFSRGADCAGQPGGGSPFESAILACEGIELTGSGRIDSFDSRLEAYRQSTARNGGHVRTIGDAADIELRGNSPIHGNVVATGGVLATGSSRVYGDIDANGRVELRANAAYSGDVRTTGDVLVTNTSTIEGSVAANGDIRFTNGATVHGEARAGGDVTFAHPNPRVLGDVSAGGTIHPHRNDASRHVDGEARTAAGPVGISEIAPQPCDPLAINDIVAAFEHVPSVGRVDTGQSQRERWELTPAGLRSFDDNWNVKSYVDTPAHQVEVFGQASSMIRTDDLRIGWRPLTVRGGHVVLFVDGDLDMNSSGGLVIEEGSRLTVFVTGQTTLGGSANMVDLRPVDRDGNVRFSLFSTHVDNGQHQHGVRIQGNAHVAASVYAPYANVRVTGSGGLYGAVRGNRVDVRGAGGIHFDEALADLDLADQRPGAPGSATGSAAGPATVTVRSRR